METIFFLPINLAFEKISTLDATIQFTELVYEALNNKNSSINIMVDYSKAFDTVNHPIFSHKFEFDGVRGKPLEYVESYLENRQQSVIIRGKYSNTKTTNISVPQGSVLGPLLFLLYINEIHQVVPKFVPTIFADNCTLSITNLVINYFFGECNSELAVYKSWSDVDRLAVNINKTNCLLISNTISSILTGSILLDNQELDIVHCVTFLGLMLDDKMKFDKHIQYICGKISKSIGILFRIRSLVPISY